MASAPLNITKFDHQSQSPLFGILPGEIRNEIFALALIQYEDDTALYEETSYWYRPGFKGPRKSNSALLRSCKLAYLEGQAVFLKEAEQPFWFNRGPDGRSTSEACLEYFDRLTPKNVEQLSAVRFFTQMYWLEDGHSLNKIFNCTNFRPERLTITIRYSDWWWWESNEPLRMSQRWFQVFNGCPGLRELIVEYETISWKKDQMDAIIERNKKWKLRVRDGGHLSAENTKLTEWRWRGASKLGGQQWSHHGNEDTIEYVVVVDKWVYVDEPLDSTDTERQKMELVDSSDEFDDDNDDDDDEDDDDEEEEDNNDDDDEYREDSDEHTDDE